MLISVVSLTQQIKTNTMKKLAILLGTTESELTAFYLLQVNKAKSIGFSDLEAKEIVRETFRKQLGLS
jgi:hypothetical protein